MPGKVGTYNEALTEDRDQVRMALGDTDPENFLTSDIHIDAVLTLRGSVPLAVVTLANELIAEFARQPVRTSAAGESVDYSDRLDSWRLIVAEARAQDAATSGQGGVSFIPIDYGIPSDTDEFSRDPDMWSSS